MKLLLLLLFLNVIHLGFCNPFHLPPLVRLNEKMKLLSRKLDENLNVKSIDNRELMEMKYALLSAMYKLKLATLKQLRTISKY